MLHVQGSTETLFIRFKHLHNEPKKAYRSQLFQAPNFHLIA